MAKKGDFPTIPAWCEGNEVSFDGYTIVMYKKSYFSIYCIEKIEKSNCYIFDYMVDKVSKYNNFIKKQDNLVYELSDFIEGGGLNQQSDIDIFNDYVKKINKNFEENNNRQEIIDYFINILNTHKLSV